MNWDILAAVAETLGASAVLITLIYLSIQVRAQTSQNKSNAVHNIESGFRETMAPFLNTEIALILEKANENGLETLSASERTQILAALQNTFSVWEEAFYLHQSNTLEAQIWGRVEKQFRARMSQPAMAEVWSIRKENYGTDFRRYMDDTESRAYVTVADEARRIT